MTYKMLKVSLLIAFTFSCGSDNLLVLARSESDLSKDFNKSTLTVVQANELNYSVCNNDCSRRQFRLKRGNFEVSVKLNSEPEVPPEVSLLQCSVTPQTFTGGNGQQGIFLPPPSDTNPDLCNQVNTIVKRQPMKGSATDYTATLEIPYITSDSQLKNGLAQLKVEIGRKVDGNAVAILSTILSVDDTPNSTPETYAVRLQRNLPPLLTTVKPNQAELRLNFPQAMDTSTVPSFSLLAERTIPLLFLRLQGDGSAAVRVALIPASAYAATVSWENNQTLLVADLASVLGLLPENNELIWRVSGARDAAGKTCQISTAAFP